MITYRDTSKLLFTNTNNNAALNLKSNATKKASVSEFKSIFESATNNVPTRRQTTNNVTNGERNILKGTDSDIKYKSFRDIKANDTISSVSRQDTTNNTTKTTGIKEIESESIKLDFNSVDYDEAINVLAQMLGIKPEELVKMAEDLGFDVSEITDVTKQGLFVEKLANVLSLTNSQKEMINSIFREVMKQINPEEIARPVINQTTSPTNSEILAATDSTAQTKVNAGTVDIHTISGKVQAKLEELIQNTKMSTESVGLEISKVIAAMKAQAGAKVNSTAVQPDIGKQFDAADDTLASAQNTQVEDANAKDLKEARSLRNSDSGKEKAEVAVNTVTISENVTVANDQSNGQNQQNVNIFGDIKVNAVNNQETVEKTVFSVKHTVTPKDVINQVAESTKVLIGQDKSEMVIHLKPDHLGKLELKVVTEQGIVAAKFVAESQQVKEIIESNMQLLKDSLQKQGISVEGVSVQVGHENKNEYRQQDSYGNKNNSSNAGSKFGNSNSVISKTGINMLEALPERLAQYAYESSSTINLTA